MVALFSSSYCIGFTFNVNLQFEDETFDAVIDKGGLDALMEPELGPKLGTQYLSEVFFLICLCNS